MKSTANVTDFLPDTILNVNFLPSPLSFSLNHRRLICNTLALPIYNTIQPTVYNLCVAVSRHSSTLHMFYYQEKSVFHQRGKEREM